MKTKSYNLWSVLVAGLVLCTSSFAASPPKNVIPMNKAKAAALKKHPGTVKSSELEQEEGKWIYSFDISTKDKKIQEVWVDAKTGKVIKSQVESAGEEAKEAARENG
jgi:uncharacterized membrane protein YkoI